MFLRHGPAFSLCDNEPCYDKCTLAVLLDSGIPVASTSRNSRCTNDPGIKQSKGFIWQFFNMQGKKKLLMRRGVWNMRVKERKKSCRAMIHEGGLPKSPAWEAMQSLLDTVKKVKQPPHWFSPHPYMLGDAISSTEHFYFHLPPFHGSVLPQTHLAMKNQELFKLFQAKEVFW